MTAAIHKFDTHYNDKAYDAPTYNAIVAKGKLNLKKVSSWEMTELYSLRAASLLTTISSNIDEASTVLSETINSHLSLFAIEDAPMHSPSVASHTIRYATPHRHIVLGAQSDAFTTPNTDQTLNDIVTQPNTTSLISNTIPLRRQNIAQPNTHDVVFAFEHDRTSTKPTNTPALNGVVACGNVLASLLTLSNVIEPISQSLYHHSTTSPTSTTVC